MQQLIKNFYREGRGRWVCAQSCRFNSPVGAIHVATGTTVMRGYAIRGFDLAAALDAEMERQERERRS